MKSYEIIEGYEHNTVNLTKDNSNNIYWNRKRIHYSMRYQWHVYIWAIELINKYHYNNVVDVGCGAGVKLNELIAPIVKNFVGIDQPSAIKFCKEAYSVGTYLSDDLESPDQEPGIQPELIICCDVIEHLNDPDMLLAYLKRISNENTYFLISTPDRDRLRGKGVRVCPNPSHIREWSATEFRRYINKSGFNIIEARYFPPLKMGLDLLTIVHIIRQIKPTRQWRYNYALLCSLK